MRAVLDLEIAAVVQVAGSYFSPRWVEDMLMIVDTNGNEYCAFVEDASAFVVGAVATYEVEPGRVPGGSWLHPHG